MMANKSAAYNLSGHFPTDEPQPRRSSASRPLPTYWSLALRRQGPLPESGTPRLWSASLSLVLIGRSRYATRTRGRTAARRASRRLRCRAYLLVAHATPTRTLARERHA